MRILRSGLNDLLIFSIVGATLMGMGVGSIFWGFGMNLD